MAASNGVATFNNLTITAPSSYTITASDTTLGTITAATTNSFTVTPGAEKKLVITTQPAASLTAGGTVAVGVTIEDQYGNTITTGNTGSNDTIHVALSSGGFAAGTTSVAASGGVATFSGLQVNAAGSYTITATDTTHGTVTAATTNSFTVSPGAEGKLVITTQPAASITAGGTASVGVTVEDQYGNPITTGNTGSNDTIHVALSSGSFAAGTTSVAASNGVATFSGLQVTAAGSYTITASDTTDGAVTAATTNSITVSPAAENKLVITTQPASPVAAGATITVGVTIEDQYGNTITTGNTGSNDTIHVALSSGSFAGGTTSVAASGGVATFNNLTVTTPGSYTITASDTTHGTVTAATTNSITVNPGAESKLAITAQPASITAGGTVSVGVTVEDQYGNPITSGTGSGDTIHVALSSGNFAAGTTSVAASGGVASFSGLQINAAGSYTITASDTTDGAVTATTTNSITVSPAAENKLVITTQPASPVAAGATITVGVTIEDQYGNTITTGNTGSNDTIHVALSSGSFAGGTTAVAASGGVATFNNLTVTTPGSYTVTASDTTDGLVTAATTNSFTVNPGAENKLAITAQPASITAGGTASVGVTVEDQYGNPITSGTGSGDTIHVALSSGSFAGGTTSVAASGGVASFSGLQVNAAASYTITATDTTHGTVTAAITNSFTVSPAAENKLVITTQPASPVAAGATITVGATVEDQYGNTITTGNTGSNDTIQVVLSSGSFASGTTSVAASGGVATFNNLTVTTPGSYTVTASDTTDGLVTAATTNSFTVTPAAENKLVITAQPASITAGGTVSVGVTIEDQYGNTITTGNTGSNDTIHVALSSGSFAGGTTSVAASSGVASFSGLKVTAAASYTITASDTTNGGVTVANTNSFTVSPAAENKLAITAQPASITAGGSAALGVTVEDQYGNPITSGTGSADTIHVALSSGSFAAGTTTTAASGGSASFSGLQINAAASYTITASDTTDGAVTAANTNSFTVSPAAENKLVIAAQPASITAGGTVSVGVTIEDQYGNTITTGNTGSNDTIHVALSSGSFAGGTTSVAASNGVATLSGLQVTAAGSYTITASDTTDGAVTAANTNSFTVTPAAENTLAITAQPAASITAGGTVSVGVTIEDQYGNTITTGNTGSNDTIHVALSSGSFAAGTTSVAASNGVATFSGLQVTAAGSYTITATDTTHGTVTAATTNSFTVSPLGENKLAITTQPPAKVANGSTVTVGVTVEDQYGNPITSGTGSADTIHVALSSGSFASGTTSVVASSGVATFSNLTITTNGTYTITATDTSHGTVTSATTTSFKVEAPVTVAQSKAGSTAGHTTSVTLTSTPTAGTTLIVLAYGENGFGTPAAPTISGNGVTGTATQITSESEGSNYAEYAFWVNASGTGTTITSTFASGVSESELDVFSLAGNNTTSPIVQSDTNTGTSTTPTAILPTTPAAGDLEIAMFGTGGQDGSLGATPTGWTNVGALTGTNGGHQYGEASYYTNTNASTSQAFSMGDSVAWGTIALDIGLA